MSISRSTDKLELLLDTLPVFELDTLKKVKSVSLTWKALTHELVVPEISITMKED